MEGASGKNDWTVTCERTSVFARTCMHTYRDNIQKLVVQVCVACEHGQCLMCLVCQSHESGLTAHDHNKNMGGSERTA